MATFETKPLDQYSAPPSVDSSMVGADNGSNNVVQNPSANGSGIPPAPSKTPTEVQPNDDGIADAVVDAQAQQNNNGSSDDTIPTFEEDDEVIKYLEEQRDANRRLTPDEVKKLRRKQRTEEIVSGISDAVRSLSNLFFTSQYAPNMYDHSKGMSEATKARWDKTWKEREAENDRFMDYALKIRSLKAQKAATQYQHARDKMLDELKEREQTRKEDWDAWRIESGKLDNDIKSKQLEIAQATGDAKVKAQNELAEMYKARAELYNRTPMMGGSRSGGKPGEYPWFDKDGNKHYASSYEAMRQNAIQNGTWEEATQTSTTTKKGGSGFGTQTTTTAKPGKGHSSNPSQGKKHADL